MKKQILVVLVLSCCWVAAFAQPGINVAFQFNTLGNISKAAGTTEKERAIGIGIGANINKKILKIPFVFEPRILFNKQGVTTSSNISNLKTTYVQIPVLLRLFARKTLFENSISSESSANFGTSESIVFSRSSQKTGGITGFAFSLDAGMYVGWAIAGKYNGSTKMNYGEGLTDNRAKIDYGFSTTLAFGPAFSSFRGYIQIQRGFNNVIPSARVVGDATRKLNAFNVGLSFMVKTRKK